MFALDNRALHCQWHFWLALTLPVLFYSLLAYGKLGNLEFDYKIDAIVYLTTETKQFFFIFIIGTTWLALVITNHRSIIICSQNNMVNFLKHRDEFYKHIQAFEDGHNVMIESKIEIYIMLFPSNSFSSVSLSCLDNVNKMESYFFEDLTESIIDCRNNFIGNDNNINSNTGEKIALDIGIRAINSLKCRFLLSFSPLHSGPNISVEIFGETLRVRQHNFLAFTETARSFCQHLRDFGNDVQSEPKELTDALARYKGVSQDRKTKEHLNHWAYKLARKPQKTPES